MSRLLQGSHASRLAFASVCLGSSAAWLVRPLVASCGRLGWSSPASVRLLVGCLCWRCWSPGCSPGWLRGVMDRGGLDGLSFERGGLQCALCLGGWGSSLMRSLLPSLLRLLRLGRSSRRAGLILFCASRSPPFERGGLVFACLITLASAAPLGSAIHSG